MRKIPTIFERNPENMRELLTEPNIECLWVFDGQGVATRKYDGTCCKIDKDGYWKRREVKKGKTAPDGFIQESYDGNTGKRTGWVKVDKNNPEDKYHMAGYSNTVINWEPITFQNGTYELVGPKIQGNPEDYLTYYLVNHARAETYDVPRDFDSIKNWLVGKDIEGLVFHHSDGRMGKIKKRDFGMKRAD